MKLSEEIEDILGFLRLEVSKRELVENFETIDRKIERLLVKNKDRKKEIKENKLFERLLNEERRLLLDIRRTIKLIRLEKIVRLIGEKESIKNMTDEEKEILSTIRGVIEAKITKEVKEKREIMAVVLKDIPAFIGISGAEYGPFRPGDVIKIDERDLKMLIERGFVKPISEKGLKKES